MNSTGNESILDDSMLIRDLIETYPVTMPILAAHGLDLCCGGGHPIGEAIRLHRLDSTAVTRELLAAIVDSESDSSS